MENGGSVTHVMTHIIPTQLTSFVRLVGVMGCVDRTHTYYLVASGVCASERERGRLAGASNRGNWGKKGLAGETCGKGCWDSSWSVALLGGREHRSSIEDLLVKSM